MLLGRYLAEEVDILLVEEPTRGVDIGAKSEIYRLLRDFANRGGAVLVLSRETIELIGLCDRIYVMHGDTVAAELPADHRDRTRNSPSRVGRVMGKVSVKQAVRDIAHGRSK